MNLVTGSSVVLLTGALMNHFDTFSQNIVIHKEPKKTITQTNTGVYAGYGNSQQNVTYTNVPVSGVYPARRIYDYEKDMPNQFLSEIKKRVDKNLVIIKVKRDARDFIKNGKTESVIVDENAYKIAGNDIVQNFLGLKFYYFLLEGSF